jgi:hypothetical protein
MAGPFPHETDFNDPGPRFWNGGSVARTIVFDAFSLMFPAAEAFMIRAARDTHDRVAEPALRREIAGFMRQESTHARLHAAYNRAMEARGFDATRQEQRNADLIFAMEARIGTRRRIAAGAGLEHFTALVADAIVAEPALLRDADPRYHALWLWHAREEIEHRAVAFDVHEAVYPDGAWLSRTRAMLASLAILFVLYGWNVWRLAGDVHEQSRLRTLAGVAWVLFGAPGLFRRTFLPMLAFFVPGFHPDGSARRRGQGAHFGGRENGLGERPGAGGFQVSHSPA